MSATNVVIQSAGQPHHLADDQSLVAVECILEPSHHLTPLQQEAAAQRVMEDEVDVIAIAGVNGDRWVQWELINPLYDFNGTARSPFVVEIGP